MVLETLVFSPFNHLTRLVAWEDLASLDAEARRKILCWGSNPSRPVHSQTLYWLSYPSSSSKAGFKLI
jgi:hypothetical protein